MNTHALWAKRVPHDIDIKRIDIYLSHQQAQEAQAPLISQLRELKHKTESPGNVSEANKARLKSQIKASKYIPLGDADQGEGTRASGVNMETKELLDPLLL